MSGRELHIAVEAVGPRSRMGQSLCDLPGNGQHPTIDYQRVEMDSVRVSPWLAAHGQHHVFAPVDGSQVEELGQVGLDLALLDRAVNSPALRITMPP
jgi:hypothetical protein